MFLITFFFIVILILNIHCAIDAKGKFYSASVTPTGNNTFDVPFGKLGIIDIKHDGDKARLQPKMRQVGNPGNNFAFPTSTQQVDSVDNKFHYRLQVNDTGIDWVIEINISPLETTKVDLLVGFANSTVPDYSDINNYQDWEWWWIIPSEVLALVMVAIAILIIIFFYFLVIHNKPNKSSKDEQNEKTRRNLPFIIIGAVLTVIGFLLMLASPFIARVPEFKKCCGYFEVNDSTSFGLPNCGYFGRQCFNNEHRFHGFQYFAIYLIGIVWLIGCIGFLLGWTLFACYTLKQVNLLKPTFETVRTTKFKVTTTDD